MNLSFVKEKFVGIFEKGLLDELEKIGNYMELEEGHVIMRPGGYIRTVPIVLSGSIKILRPDDEGREALLYYLGGMDSCAMSLSCCLDRKQSEILAITEEKTTLITIPVEKVEEWMCKYSTWKQFVFLTYQRRFEDLLNAIDEIAFHKLDERLLNLLQRKSKQSKSSTINITHEVLAGELATSREVVSRLLKQLEKIGKVKLSRNKIELC
ncbi:MULTISPECIES: Crp/Fnr family transcriptional regulator [Flectobacillus]|jgi:CRP/FNR family transcriptional regulator|uniref:Crp/Fnr family transcriptional regulator n=1 Tax=Flectobacillus roseus TaxID=502259 RepID=A0ABT6YCF0_9BACT|nr:MULTISPECIES: Crp/Fnr family transcriptional regulator [Flectobacillus]MDI9860876.1 Crp/Fnr family transcriptional regulator [Flectobacillus roseus]MDI9870682.1 Crp/Fnr family transcriptional regulator [Flectobacillus roseus]NBA76265.1 helix-turn-helix domain-containing protein [Emticicia sp. ODNR4P]PAC32812.1 Crp/Fnr family transcriptional regulator [Flectobacillus sp. BAB-3569]